MTRHLDVIFALQFRQFYLYRQRRHSPSYRRSAPAKYSLYLLIYLFIYLTSSIYHLTPSGVATITVTAVTVCYQLIDEQEAQDDIRENTVYEQMSGTFLDFQLPKLNGLLD